MDDSRAGLVQAARDFYLRLANVAMDALRDGEDERGRRALVLLKHINQWYEGEQARVPGKVG